MVVLVAFVVSLVEIPFLTTTIPLALARGLVASFVSCVVFVMFVALVMFDGIVAFVFPFSATATQRETPQENGNQHHPYEHRAFHSIPLRFFMMIIVPRI